MPTLDGLGGLFNPVPLANSAHVRVLGAGVTFVAYAAGGIDALTHNEGIDGGSAQALAGIREVYKGPAVGGPWTKIEQTAAATFTHTDSTNIVLVTTILAGQLSPGYNTLAVTAELSASEQWCVALVHDLAVALTPERLGSNI